MNFTKIGIWIIGPCVAVAGGMLIYFYGYKNNQYLDAVSYFLVFGTWFVLFTKAVKGTIIGAPKIPFKTNKAGFFRQKIVGFFAYAILFLAMFVVWTRLDGMRSKRKDEILAMQPTDTTTATISHIDVRHYRRDSFSSYYYYPVVQYVVKGKTITYSFYEGKEPGEYLVGDKYLVRYSVEYPDMMEFLQKVN